MTTKNESPILVLPEDKELVKKLHKKFQEYNERIKTYHKDHLNQHPDFRDRMMALNICKKTILGILFQEKRIVAWDASKKFVGECMKRDEGSGPTFVNAWVDAWSVIQDYCETGGANVHGGTGLQH